MTAERLRKRAKPEEPRVSIRYGKTQQGEPETIVVASGKQGLIGAGLIRGEGDETRAVIVDPVDDEHAKFTPLAETEEGLATMERELGEAMTAVATTKALEETLAGIRSTPAASGGSRTFGYSRSYADAWSQLAKRRMASGDLRD